MDFYATVNAQLCGTRVSNHGDGMEIRGHGQPNATTLLGSTTHDDEDRDVTVDGEGYPIDFDGNKGREVVVRIIQMVSNSDRARGVADGS